MSMKEIFDAFAARVKSPVFGYFFFALVAVNWKALFLLFASESPPLERVTEFENLTSIATLFFYPFIISSLVAIIYPWINYAFLYISKKPTNLRNLIQAQAEHALLVKKQELEEERMRLSSTKEKALIDQATRDKEIEEIDNIAVREKLKSEIESLRSKSQDKDLVNIDNRERIKKEIELFNEIAKNYREKGSSDKYSNIDKQQFNSRASEMEYEIEKKVRELKDS